MRYCTQCGKPLAENALFCAYCGAKVVIPEQPAQPEPVPEEIVKPAEEPVVEEPVAEEPVAEEPKPVEEAAPAEEPAPAPKAAQPETDFAPEPESAPQPAPAPQPDVQPQTHQSAVYTAPAEYKAAPAAVEPKKKGGLVLPILAIVLSCVAGFVLGIFIGLITLAWRGMVPINPDDCVTLARAFVSMLGSAALVLGIIGLIKNIKAKKVAGIVLSAIGIVYALSMLSMLGNIGTIADIVYRMMSSLG